MPKTFKLEPPIFNRSKMRERHLKITVEDAIAAFTGLKWKFYEKREREIRVEVPRTDSERFVVELCFNKDDELAAAEKKLKAAGFIPQEIRYAAA